MRRLFTVVTLAVLAPLTFAGLGPASAQGGGFDLGAKRVVDSYAELPDTTTSNSADTMLDGTKGWDLFLENRSAQAVTNATVTVDSGYDPSLFYWGGPVPAFPASHSTPSVAAGNGVWDTGGPLGSSIPVRFSAGYDSTRTVDTTTIPVGGGQQTTTVTITPRDTSYADPALYGRVSVMIGSNLPGVSSTSWTGPDNLNQGEQLSTPAPPPDEMFLWILDGVQVGKQYRFTMVLNVPNPGTAPLDFRPRIQVGGTLESSQTGSAPSSSVTVADPQLDGTVPGRGQITYAVTQTGHTWTRFIDRSATVVYRGTPAASPTEVPIAVKPMAAPPVPINLKDLGQTPVAILSTDNFDATTVDPSTVRFGASGTEAKPSRSTTQDVNRDHHPDLLLRFPTQQCGFTLDSTSATLTGQTPDGEQIQGTEAVRVVP